MLEAMLNMKSLLRTVYVLHHCASCVEVNTPMMLFHHLVQKQEADSFCDLTLV